MNCSKSKFNSGRFYINNANVEKIETSNQDLKDIGKQVQSEGKANAPLGVLKPNGTKATISSAVLQL